MRLSILQIDDADQTSSTYQRNGQESFKVILRQFVKHVETRIFTRALLHDNGFTPLRHPARDSLAQFQLQAIDQFRMRILGSSKNQLVMFKNIDKTGIALHNGDDKFDDLV